MDISKAVKAVNNIPTKDAILLAILGALITLCVTVAWIAHYISTW